ncbi:aminoacyl tRNA synthase complex-interacting multifunctional protein 1-like [Artemia franciscana]
MGSIVKLRQRAEATENLLQILKNEVNRLEVLFSSGVVATGKNTELESLRQENKTLKSEVENLKMELNKGKKSESVKPLSSPDFSKPVVPEVNGVVQRQTKKEEVHVPKETMSKKKEEKTAKVKVKPEAKGDEDGSVDVGRLDFRVGKILEARRHPDADSLYVEDVDLGEGKLRTVVSGLVKFVPLEEMQNRLAVFLCNLKPAKMRGIMSEAMVMCASTPDKVEILSPPAGSQIGDLVEVEGYKRQPDAVLNPKKKIWVTVAPDLKTNEFGAATYKGVPLFIPGKGNIISQTLKGVQVK